ncbi:MAG: hypothetical protein AAFU67_03515 [Bacteroidota bacterium]
MYDDFQDHFFRQLGGQFPQRGRLAEAVSDTLALSKDAAYRRLSGATSLTADEMLRLSIRFQVPLPNPSKGIEFRYNQLEQKIRAPKDYLNQMEQYLELVDNWPEKTLYYATPDLPFFYEMLSPNLLAFKFYVFGIASWGFKHWEDQPFRRELIDSQDLERAAEIGRYAYRIPTLELWTTSVLDSTLSQVEYMTMTGRFADPQYALLIIDDLSEVVDHIEKIAIAGKKFAPGDDPKRSNIPFSLHYNELLYVSTTILIHSPQANLLFLSFITPNYLQTADPILGREVKEWFDGLIEAATKLGEHTSKYRNWYFNRLRGQIESTRKRVERIILDREI